MNRAPTPAMAEVAPAPATDGATPPAASEASAQTVTDQYAVDCETGMPARPRRTWRTQARATMGQLAAATVGGYDGARWRPALAED